jgi:ribosomal protein L11
MVREREISSLNSNKPFQTLKFMLPAGEALSQPPLSATLGQAQINSTEFCKQFNSLSTNFYYPGVLVNVSVTKRSDNTLNIQVGDIFLPFIFFQAIRIIRGKRKRRIYIETLYDIFQLYKTFQTLKFSKTSMNSNESSVARKFLGVLRSIRFKIKF